VVTIVVPSVWTKDRSSYFHVEEGPLGEVLKRFVAQRPECRDRVMGPDGEPLMFVNVSVDDRLVPRQERAATVVPAGSTVILISPMAGG
jgi:sulfur-carrier protein